MGEGGCSTACWFRHRSHRPRFCCAAFYVFVTDITPRKTVDSIVNAFVRVVFVCVRIRLIFSPFSVPAAFQLSRGSMLSTFDLLLRTFKLHSISPPSFDTWSAALFFFFTSFLCDGRPFDSAFLF